MITTIYFVRHAHSIYTSDEISRPLSPQGWEDAERVTKQLENENIDRVIASPYKRAIQTVEGVAKSTGVKIQLDDGLRERLLSSEPLNDFSTAVEKVWSDSTYACDGGESNDTAQKRGVQSFIRILKVHCGEKVVIGTHGNIMVLIMNHFDPSYHFSFWQSLKMPDIYKLSFDDLKLVKVEPFM